MTPTHPGDDIQEPAGPVHTVAGAATSIAAFVGYTARGIDHRAQQILSFADYERLFGGLAPDSELSYAVQQFFANGGTHAYVARTPRNGATAAQVAFGGPAPGGLTFSALNSGAWANGQLLIDVDSSGLSQTLAGSVKVTAGSATVTGAGAGFQIAAGVGQWLVFSSDGTRTPYQIQAVASDTRLTLTANYAGTTATATATISADPLAFNLTVTNLADGTVERFPNLSLNAGLANYVASVVNDPGNGSQLVGVQATGTPAGPPTPSGLVGTPITVAATNHALGATAFTGTVKVTNGHPKAIGTLTPAPTAGQFLVFAADPTCSPYVIESISGNDITLTANYTGPSAASTTASLPGAAATHDFGIQILLTSPAAAVAPFPIDIKVFPKNSPLAQTVTGLAAQIQQSINQALAIAMPGASVTCSVAAVGTSQALRLNGLIPHFPDAVLAVTAPGGGLGDAATALGLQSPATISVTHYALGTGNGAANSWGGNLTSSVAGSDGGGLPGTQQLVGDPAQSTGIYALQKVDLFNLLCIPDATRAHAGDPGALDSSVDPNTIYSAAIALCAQRRAFLLVDAPPNVGTASGALDWKSSQLAVHDPNGAAFFPRLRLPDPLNNDQLRTFAPCGVAAGLYARIDSTRGVWKAPAGTEATLTGVQSLVYEMSDAENDALNRLGLNCFRTFPVYGNVLWDARTLALADAEASLWRYVAVRRMALYLEESLYRSMQWAVFEPNGAPLWTAIQLNVDSFMSDLFHKGAFQGQTPSEAYLVQCDSETTSQSDIDNGIVNILVGFAPLKPAEFIIIQIQQPAGQGQAG